MIIRKIVNKCKNEASKLDFAVRPFADNKWDYFTISLDFLYCKFRFKILPGEYRKYNFPYLKNRYRKQYVLRSHQTKYNNINITAFAASKYTFYSYIPDLFKREIILAPQCGKLEFLEFFKRHQQIIIKPHAGAKGQGIKKIQYTNDIAAENFFNEFAEKSPVVCEEVIQQHPIMHALNPHSVNTIRIFSLLIDDNVELISAVLKIGLDASSITDNMSLGGIGAQIDLSSGIVSTFGKDFHYNTYPYHPITGAQIIGLQIPHWQEAIELIKIAHKRVPQCALYGWDIAITETGVDIVEGNSSPGTRILQVMDGIPKGQQLIPLLRKDRLKDKRSEYLTKLEHDYRKHYTAK